MNLINKVKSIWDSFVRQIGHKDHLTINMPPVTNNNELEDIIDKLRSDIDDLARSKANLTSENKKLKARISELEEEKKKLGYGNYIYEVREEYLPKQEPIRSSKPKRNRNNNRRRYKKKDDDSSVKANNNKEEKYKNEVTLIKNKDMPKPGSGDKFLYKNGNRINTHKSSLLC